MDIDFIIYWVDGADPVWYEKMSQYKGTKGQKSSTRFRDWGILKYWFRAVEQYAPWVHKVYFVADNQRPDWLDFNNPKLEYVDHKDFIPAEYLPTFNSHTIELNIHRIKGLSEHIVVFNDDMYINAPIMPEYYFKNGLPCDATLEHIYSGIDYEGNGVWGISIIDYCNTQIINRYFNRKEVTKGNFKRWYGAYLGLKYQLQALLCYPRCEFQHFYTPHNEKALLKSSFLEVWDKENVMLAKSCSRFRENISLNLYVMRYWHLASNKFYPTSSFKNKLVIPIKEDTIDNIKQKLFDKNCKSLCLNDSVTITEEFYKEAKSKIISLFEKKFPQKSTFEK